MAGKQKTIIQDFTEDGKYDNYPEYKETDRPWLTLPDHWDVRRMKYCAQINPSKAEVEDLNPETEVTFLPMENVSEQGEIDYEESEPIKDVIDGYTYFRDGDVLVAKITPCFENGKGALAEDLKNGIGFGTTEFVVLRTNKDLDDKFLYYVTASRLFRKVGEGYMKGAAGQKRVPDQFFQDFPQFIPPKKEQEAIIKFLNTETKWTGRLIEKKQNLIDLLEEKRNSLITNKLTSGLDEDAETTESHIPGVGEIPEAWDLAPLKYSSQNITSGLRETTHYYVDDGVPALRSTNIEENKITGDDLVYFSEGTNEELVSSQIHSGDLVSVRSGVNAGTTAVVPERFDGVNCIDLVIIRSPNGYMPEFLSLLMNSEASKSQIEARTTGAALSHFNIDEVQELVFPKPDTDIEEQKEILDWLSPRLKDIDG